MPPDRQLLLDLVFHATAVLALAGCLWIWLGLRRRRRERSPLGRTVVVMGLIVLLVMLLRLLQGQGGGGTGSGGGAGDGEAAGRGGLPASTVRGRLTWWPVAAQLHLAVLADDGRREAILSLREDDWPRRLAELLREPVAGRGHLAPVPLALARDDGGPLPIPLHLAIDQAARRTGWRCCRPQADHPGGLP